MAYADGERVLPSVQTALIAGFVGTMATYILWYALMVLFWFPYRMQMRSMHMYVHDIDLTYLVPFGPLVVGIMFLVAGALAHAAWRFTPEPQRTTLARSIMLLPGAGTFVLLNSTRELLWHYPLAEVSVLAIGAGLGWFLFRADMTTQRA